MLKRYRIVRGKRPPEEPLPNGERVDTRKHTRSILRPNADMVAALLADVDAGWPEFQRAYRLLLSDRAAADPDAFDALAERARHADVHLGCNCPTKRQPEVRRCHTVLALKFMAERYPGLDVRLPE